MALFSSPEPTPLAAEPTPQASLDALRVVAFVTDDASMAALRVGLLPLAEELDIRRGTVRQAIRFFEKQVAAQAVVVDVTGIEDAQATLDDLARVCPPDVQVFVVGENTDITFYRLLVHDLGVTEYLPKPLTRDSIQRLLLPRLSGGGAEPAAGRGGHVVAVCGARGGVGATTVAVSLALELADIAKAHVALLDLHLQGGTAALMLSGRPGPGLRIALEDSERADSLFLERTAIAVEPRLRLIAAEEPLGAILQVSSGGVARVLDLLQRKFNYVVVDLPMPVPQEMNWAVVMARQVVVVMGPDVASLRDAQAIRQFVIGTTGSDRVVTVLNRNDAKGGLAASLIERGLGGKPDAVIPDLGRRMIEAVSLGVPALRRVPALGRHMAGLVREITGLGAAVAPTSWLRRMLRA
jgi:pilus assembly protein CpaE